MFVYDNSLSLVDHVLSKLLPCHLQVKWLGDGLTYGVWLLVDTFNSTYDIDMLDWIRDDLTSQELQTTNNDISSSQIGVEMQKLGHTSMCRQSEWKPLDGKNLDPVLPPYGRLCWCSLENKSH